MRLGSVHKHHHFDHTEDLYVCPECGELLMENLPEDNWEYEELSDAYFDHERTLKSKGMKSMWQLVSLFCIFSVYIGLMLRTNKIIRPSIFYPILRRPLRYYPLFGPYNEVIKCQVGIMFLSRLGFDKIAEYFGFPARRALGEGGDEFKTYWQMRFGLLILFGLLAYFCLPNYHGFLDVLFGRKAPVAESDMAYFNNCVLTSNLLFYPVYAFVVVKESYDYRRSSLILWLNGKDEV